jgi:hypothetical protein
LSRKAWFNDCDFLRVKQKRVPYNGSEIQQDRNKDWHPILTWTGVVTGWVDVKYKRGI